MPRPADADAAKVVEEAIELLDTGQARVAEVDAVTESPIGMDSPTRKPVFFCPPTVVKALAKTDAQSKLTDSVAVTISERIPVASVV